MLCFVRAVRRSPTGVSCAARMEMCSGSPSACLVSCSVGFGAKRRGLSPGPEAWLSHAGSQCLGHWERWLSPARCRVAAHVRSVRHARVDPELSGSLKSQRFRRQCEGFCQARAPCATSHPVSRSASKVVVCVCAWFLFVGFFFFGLLSECIKD